MVERRLNPLAFPAETNGRFTILIVSAGVLTWLVSFTFLPMLAVTLGYEIPFANILQSISGVTANTASNDVYFQELSSEALAAYYQNLKIPLIQAWWAMLPWVAAPALVLVLLLGIAWFIYRLHPVWFHYRHQLLPAGDNPSDEDLVLAVSQLAAQVNMARPPDIMLHKETVAERYDGQAFGLHNRYQIRLNARLLFLLRRPQFDAMVFHELGHIINHDIWRTYFAGALWIAFSAILLVMAVVIVALDLFSLPGTQTVTLAPWGLLRRIVITLLIAAGMWANLLQIREFYADWRAASWGQEDILRQWLVGSSKKAKPWYYQFNPFRKSWWRRLRPFHPSEKARLEALTEPLKLFHITWQLPFLTGLLLAIAMIGLPMLVLWLSAPILGLIEIVLTTWAASLFQTPSSANFILFFLANMVFKLIPLTLLITGILAFIGYLLTQTLGVQVQRETIADMANKTVLLRSYGRLIPTAIWLSIGVQLGLLLTPVGYTLPERWSMVALTLGWLLGFSLLTWLWLAFVRALTQIVLGSHVGSTDPKRKKRFVNFLSSFSLVFLYPPAFLLLAQAWIGDRAFPSLLVGSSDLTAVQFMAMNVFMLFLIAFIYFFGAVTFLVILYGVMAVRSPARCPNCGEMTNYKLVMGQDCPYCHQPLSLWIYVRTKSAL